MSVAWSRVALPGSRQTCGHPKCRWLSRWATAVITGACVAALAGGAAFPAAGPLIVTVAALIAAAGLVLACWPHPPGDDIEALIQATREMTPRPRLEWTDAEWAEREKELSEL